MARYAITRRVTTPHQLEGFDLEGYAYDKLASSPSAWYSGASPTDVFPSVHTCTRLRF